MTKLYDITVERVKTPLAVKRFGVRFGWKLDSDAKNVFQTGYTVRVSLDGAAVWEKSEQSGETTDITADAALLPGRLYTVRIESQTTDGETKL